MNLVNVGTSSVSLPRVRTKSTSSWVVMRPGAVIVMGGLLDSVENNKDAGPPGLAQAQGLGMLFRKEGRIKVSRELLVVLRANLAQ